MSRCELYAIHHDGSIHHYGDAKNSWGGAMHIWDTLARKYFQRPFGPPISAEDKAFHEDFWQEFYRAPPRLKPHERIVLGFTYQRVWVKRANLLRLAGALQVFWDHHHKGYDRFGAPFPIAPTILEILAHVKNAAQDEALKGLCFNQTSVDSDAWEVPMTYAEALEAGYPRDEYTEEDHAAERPRRMFDFSKDTEVHGGVPWELFEVLEAPAVQDVGGPP